MDRQHPTPALRAERGHARLSRLRLRAMRLDDFFAAAEPVLLDAVGYEASCWLSFDPSTLMPTGHFAPQVGSVHLLELAANEFLEDDVNKFADLARASPPVATLLGATDGEPRRSARFRNTLEPVGFGSGDELRAVFRAGDAAWGGVILHRHSGAFGPDDVEVVAALGPVLADGIRAAILAAAAAVGVGADLPGTVLLGQDDRIDSLTTTGRQWLTRIVEVSLEPGALPMVVAGVADQARRLGAHGSGGAARALVPLRDGGWLLVHGAPLENDHDQRVAITFAPIRQPDMVALIVGTYGLSPREREIALLVLSGRSTEEIAVHAGISPYTVQDHLKSVFDKVGVRSRRELVAEVFFRHYAPQLAPAATLISNRAGE